jgi:Rrf2 family protein
MRLTRAAEYAVRCMVYLAAKGPGVLASKQDIALSGDIPPHFLAKIAQELAKAGMIEIRQGAKGGFVLLREPWEVNLLEVIETIIGEISLNDCVARPGSCNAVGGCAVHRVWMQVRDQLRESLRQVTFDQLIKGDLCLPGLQTIIPKLSQSGERTVNFRITPEEGRR